VTALVLVILAQLADVVTFAAAAAALPLSHESNGLARVLGTWSIALVPVAKLLLLLPILAIIERLEATHRRWLLAGAVAIPAGMGLAGAAANLVSLAMAWPR